MATEVIMPKLSMTMEEGEIVEWHKDKGDQVVQDEVLLEVMSDKANLEVEAPADGVLLKKLYTAGDSVSITEVVGIIGEKGEDVSDMAADLKSKAEESQPPETAAEEAPSEAPAVEETSEAKDQFNKVKASPAARRIAREAGLDLSQVSGSGPHGRVVEADAEEFAAQQKQQKATPTAKKVAADKGVKLAEAADSKSERVYKQDVLDQIAETELTKQQLTGLQKAGAKRLQSSWREIPHVTVTAEVEMTETLAVIDKINNQLEEQEVSVTDVILKALAAKLADYPKLNAYLEEEEIVTREAINLGLAVDVDGNLVVPVLENVDQKGLAEINQTKVKLAEKARANQLTQTELSASNLTVSNLGMYGIDVFTPIINAPGSGILGVGQIKKKTVPREGEVVIRPMMWLSLSFDHRLVNGAPAAEFLQSIKQTLEQPELLMI